MAYWRITRITDEKVLKEQDKKLREEFDRLKGIVDAIHAKNSKGISDEDLLKEVPVQDRKAVENMLPLLDFLDSPKQ